MERDTVPDVYRELMQYKTEPRGDVLVAIVNNLPDFAIFCDRGKIDVQTDGDTWHADPARIPLDNLRDNDLTGQGWSVLRFNGQQVRESAVEYCVPAIMKTSNHLGGIVTGGIMPRAFDPDNPGGPRQLALFESGPDYEVG